MKNKGYVKFGGGGEGQIRCTMGDVQLELHVHQKKRNTVMYTQLKIIIQIPVKFRDFVQQYLSSLWA